MEGTTIGITNQKRDRSSRGRSLFLVKGKPQRHRREKPGSMCVFTGGYHIVQVWSRTEQEHAAALAIYKKKKWELIKGPDDTGYPETPIRSKVRRKIAMRDEP